MNNPKNVHLVTNPLRLRLGHHQVEQCALAVRLKLVAVRVVEEFQSMFGERGTGTIEDRGRLATGLFVERVLVRNPGAAGVLQAERLRLARYVFEVVAQLFKGEMTADRFQSLGVELFFEFLRSEFVSAGQLDVLNAKAADAVESRWNILGELLAQAVELKPDRPFETGSGAGRMLIRGNGGVDRKSQDDGTEQGRQ